MSSTSSTSAGGSDRRAALVNGGLIAAFFVSYVAARLLVRDDTIPALVRFGLCILPAVLGGVLIRQIVRFVQSLADELDRRIQLEAFAFAFPAGLLISIALGFVDHSRLLHIDPWDYWLFHLPMYFLGLILARRRYQ